VVDERGTPIDEARVGLEIPRADPVEATSASDGRFELRFELEGDRRLDLAIRAGGFASASWNRRLRPSETWDLGECVLYRSGDLAVRVVDPTGVPQLARVRADSLGEAVSPYRATTHRSLNRPRKDGVYSFEGLPAGQFLVSAENDIEPPVRDTRESPANRTVEVLPGTVTEVELVVETSRRIVVDLDLAPPFSFWSPSPSSPTTCVRLLGAGVVRNIEHLPGGETGFDDVPPGVYSIEVLDPCFLPATADGVLPGSRVRMEVVGSGALRVSIADTDPAAYETHRLSLRRPPGRLEPRGWVELGPLPPKGEAVQGIPPGTLHLRVLAPDGAQGETRVVELAPNETRDVVVRVQRHGSISGVVRSEDGQPVDQATVFLQPGDSTAPSLNDPQKCKRDGSFVFRRLAPGRYELRAKLGACVGAPALGVVVEPEATTNVTLRLPTPSFLGGRFEDWGGIPGRIQLRLEPTAGFDSSLRAELAGWERLERSDLFQRMILGSTRQDGSFRLGPVAPGGPYALEITTGSRPVELARFDLAEGENDVGLLSFTGSLQLTVTFEDESFGSGFSPPRAWIAGPGGLRFEELDRGGVARFGPLVPGSYRFGAQGRAGSDPNAGAWYASAGDTVDVLPAAVAGAELHVARVEGTLRVLDRYGSPLADRQVALRAVVGVLGEGESLLVDVVQDSSDGDGYLTTSLPVGAYQVVLAGEPERFDDSNALVDWTLAGPDPSEVRMR